MLDLALLRRPELIAATVAAQAAGAGVLALMSLVPTSIERGLGGGPLIAVSALFAWSGSSVVTALRNLSAASGGSGPIRRGPC